MKRLIFCAIASVLSAWGVGAQISPGAYKAVEMHGDTTRNHLLLVSDNYIIHTTYDSQPAHFISTMGGFYEIGEDSLRVDLEFNTDYEKTGEKVHRVSYGYADGNLIFNENHARPYRREPDLDQPLDGAWLFATRGPDTGQERRGDNSARKTLKFLNNGYFQWVAYNSETMDFMGSGGGRYAAAWGPSWNSHLNARGTTGTTPERTAGGNPCTRSGRSVRISAGAVVPLRPEKARDSEII